MESLSSLLVDYQITQKDKNLRRQLMKELYELYEKDSQSYTQIVWRKKENWKRYLQWLRLNRLPHTAESVRRFRTSRRYIRPLGCQHFAIKLSVIKTEDLYWTISNVKEKGFGWLFNSIK